MSIADFLQEQVLKCYWRETRTEELLEQISKKHLSPSIHNLVENLKQHTISQLSALRAIGDLLQQRAEMMPCPTFQTLCREGQTTLTVEVNGNSAMQNFQVIFLLKQVISFKDANYSILATFFHIFNNSELAILLEKCLLEERERYAQCTVIAAGIFFKTGSGGFTE